MNLGLKAIIRSVFVVIILGSLVGLGYSYITAATGSDTEYGGDNQRIAQRGNITVVSTDSNTFLGRASDGPRSNAELVAFAPDGNLLYYNDSHTRYWDVDPVSDSGADDDAVVEYLYSDHLNASECPDALDEEYWRTHEYANSTSWEHWERYARAHADEEACTRNGIVRVNLQTEETTEIYSAVTPGKHSTRWHDGDRINATHYAVADIFLDRVFVVNTKTGAISWQWNAHTEYAPEESGGEPIVDWTHMNDVEVLPDGRLMADLRNHDSVVFLDPTEPQEQALQDGWTLGELDNHSILYEQHNPDYLPRENGGPAVVIGDSENNRVVEYQRQNGSWSRTWEWKDARIQWPRDADRLPNGNTLITDSNGDRVFEVDRSGEIVWSVDIAFPYEAERLPVDESDGPSTTADVPTSNADSSVERLILNVKDIVAGPVFSATQYVLPKWVGLVEFGGIVVVALSLLSWGSIELWWLLPRLRTRLRQGSGP